MKCLVYFGLTSVKEHTSAQLSGRGELPGGARVRTLFTLGKCTLGFKRKAKMMNLVSASTKGFQGVLGLGQVLQERHGSDLLLLPPGVLVDQASRTKEKGSHFPTITSENAFSQPKKFPSVHVSLSHCRYP